MSPAKSKAQYRYLQGVAHGTIKSPSGLSKQKAAEFVDRQSLKGLPKRATKISQK